VHAIELGHDDEGQGTPLAHPRAMPTATTNPSSHQASQDAPAATTERRDELARAERKQGQPPPCDDADDTYDLACTD